MKFLDRYRYPKNNRNLKVNFWGFPIMFLGVALLFFPIGPRPHATYFAFSIFSFGTTFLNRELGLATIAMSILLALLHLFPL
ncbi:MAG: hypothetical protein KF852_05845 [Saprospiraceae bacterium]|nr:hypothetical protein [Saprospiraceae bacterium]